MPSHLADPNNALPKTVAAATPSIFIMASLGPFVDTEYTPSLPSITQGLSVSYGQAQLTIPRGPRPRSLHPHGLLTFSTSSFQGRDVL